MLAKNKWCVKRQHEHGAMRAAVEAEFGSRNPKHFGMFPTLTDAVD